MHTHALAVTGTGGTGAASKTQIGSNLTLPAGGPWIIHHIWGQVAMITTVPNEGTGGQLIIESASGDLSPDPAPGKYPLIGSPVHLSANSSISAVPLNLWPTRWEAAGKSVVSLYYVNQLAITTGSIVAAGIIFSDAIPEVKPLVFCDNVYSSFASASEASIGTITLAEKATRIVGVLADLNKGDAASAGEAIVATIRLASDDIKMPPAQYPCNRAFNAADGTPAGECSTPQSQFIPINIPVEGGARIDVYATTTASITGNADLNVFIAYE